MNKTGARHPTPHKLKQLKLESMTTKEKTTFRVHVPNLLKEVTENALTANSGVLFVPLNVFRKMINNVAIRASQLNDPILNDLMCKMALYEISDPTSKEYNADIVKEISRLSDLEKTK